MTAAALRRLLVGAGHGTAGSVFLRRLMRSRADDALGLRRAARFLDERLDAGLPGVRPPVLHDPSMEPGRPRRAPSVGEGDGYLKYITVRTAPLLAGLSSGFHHPEFFELGVGEGALFRLGTMRPLVVRRYGFEVTIPAFVS